MSFLTLWRSGKRISPIFHTSIKGTLATRARLMSSIDDKTDVEKDKPFKYLGTAAAQWKARQTRYGDGDEMLWYQPIVVSTSLVVFMIYFFILREENDLDLLFDVSLNERIPGIEKNHLLSLHERLLDDGKDVTHVEKRLKEILLEERAQAAEKKVNNVA